MAKPLENVTVVLVDPLYGGNLGSAARAMMNFGLTDLRLVRPAEGIFEDKALLPMARGPAKVILDNVRIHDNLTDAISDVELAMGFTTRLGKKRGDGMDLRPAMEKLVDAPPDGTIAAVFGSEDKGLSNDDLEKCHLLVRIPTEPGLPSMNLAQAVALFSYEIGEARRKIAGFSHATRQIATVEQLEGLYGQLEEMLDKIGFIEEKSPDRMMNVMRHMLSRRMPDPREVRILRGILSKIRWHLERHKAW